MNSKLRSQLLALSIMGAMINSGDSMSRKSKHSDFYEDEPIKKIIPKGCKEYSFYGFTVIAISEKSARKKCKKLMDKNHSQYTKSPTKNRP